MSFGPSNLRPPVSPEDVAATCTAQPSWMSMSPTVMPAATMGGISLVLYGMISAVGVRNVVENKVDFTNTRNVIIAALILVLAIGINYAGSIQIGIVSLSGLAVASIVGILLNAILPGKDYEFGVDAQGDTSVNFKV